MYYWNVRKISNNEYHVIETRFVNEPEFILAKCSGPVPAYDIVCAMKVAQKIKNNTHSLYNAISSIKRGIDLFNEEIEDVAKHQPTAEGVN